MAITANDIIADHIIEMLDDPEPLETLLSHLIRRTDEMRREGFKHEEIAQMVRFTTTFSDRLEAAIDFEINQNS